MASLPPSLTGQPKPGFNPASKATGNPGETAAALAQVREAVNLLQVSLPKLPIGSEPHKAVMDSIQKLSKVVPSGDMQPGVQNSALQALQSQRQQQAPLQQAMQSMGQPQGLGGSPASGGGSPQAAA
jgi:hypothetical protein